MLPRDFVAAASLTWTNCSTGQTASKPGAGYWVGMGNRGGEFQISVAYGETIVGHYTVETEDEASLIRKRLLATSQMKEHADGSARARPR